MRSRQANPSFVLAALEAASTGGEFRVCGAPSVAAVLDLVRPVAWGATVLAAQNNALHDRARNIMFGTPFKNPTWSEVGERVLAEHHRIRRDALEDFVEQDYCDECYDSITTATAILDDLVYGGKGLVSLVPADEAVRALVRFIMELVPFLAEMLDLEINDPEGRGELAALIVEHSGTKIRLRRPPLEQVPG